MVRDGISTRNRMNRRRANCHSQAIYGEMTDIRAACNRFACWILIFSAIHLYIAYGVLKPDGSEPSPTRSRIPAYYRLFSAFTQILSVVNHIWIANHLTNPAQVAETRQQCGIKFARIWGFANTLFLLVDVFIFPLLVSSFYNNSKMNIISTIIVTFFVFFWSPVGHLWSMSLVWCYLDYFEQDAGHLYDTGEDGNLLSLVVETFHWGRIKIFQAFFPWRK